MSLCVPNARTLCGLTDFVNLLENVLLPCQELYPQAFIANLFSSTINCNRNFTGFIFKNYRDDLIF